MARAKGVGPWQKGQSGNPAGRPPKDGRRRDGSVLEECRQYIRSKIISYNGQEYKGPEGIIEILFSLALTAHGDTTRLGATKELAERYFGKVPVEQVNRNEHSIEDLDLSQLSDEEIEILQKLVKKALNPALSQVDTDKPLSDSQKQARAENALAAGLARRIENGATDEWYDESDWCDDDEN